MEFDSIKDALHAFSESRCDENISNLTKFLENGEFIVVLDDPSRENEGDLIIAASDMTTEKMGFMIRHTSGLICTPTTSEIAERLSLPQMVTSNEDPNRTAYTVSIDANHPSTSTGISAHDRALTCQTLAKPSARPEDFRRPGHIFPLKAKAGGVKDRVGHTEAAVDFCRLAGKPLVGVISELVLDGEELVGQALRKEPGMMRRDDCLAFGRTWDLKVCTIEALQAYIEHEER